MERIHERTAKACNHCHREPGWHTQIADVPHETAAPVSVQAAREPLASYEEAWAQWEREIGEARSRYQEPEARPASARKRYVVLSDLHSPFHEPSMVAEVIARESGRADTAIILGDPSDTYALSRFLQYEWMPFRDEWAITTALFDAIASAFPEVLLVLGNHDSRLEKQILQRLTPDMVEAVRYLTGGTLCPIVALSKRYPNVRIAKHTLRDGATVDWFTTIGDAWLGHPERWSKVPGSALRIVEETLADREDEWDLDRYRLIVMGHTHGYNQFAWRARSLLVESGCLCATMGYQTTPRMAGRPQRRGYLSFEQDRDVTDLNSVHFEWFDAARQSAQERVA